MLEDLALIGATFFEPEIPKDKQYLLKYFVTNIQRAFLKYFLVFGDKSSFCEHTGVHCKQRYLYQQEYRIKTILAAHAEAKKSFNLELLHKIESGKLTMRSIDKPPQTCQNMLSGPLV